MITKQEKYNELFLKDEKGVIVLEYKCLLHKCIFYEDSLGVWSY